MWIIIRLAALSIGFLVRYLNLFRKRFSFNEMLASGEKYGLIKSTHKGNLIGYYIGVPLETDTIFEISRELGTHTYLKSIGLIGEIQTGDTEFDEKYYIGSDHYYFNRALRADPAIRKLIHQLMDNSYSISSIICDGHALYINSKLVIDPPDTIVKLLQPLAEKIKLVAQTSKFSSYKDPYVYKLLIFESILFALVFYAFEVFFEHTIFSKFYLESPYKVFIPGTVTGLIIVGGFAAIFYKLFRDSSRSHFIIAGNFVMLLLGSPVWGTKTFIDLNMALDKSPVVTQSLVISNKEIQEHRRSKGGRYYTYHWYYTDPKANGEQGSIEVPYDVYISANENEKIEIKTRKGAFNYLYRLSINNIELE